MSYKKSNVRISVMTGNGFVQLRSNVIHKEFLSFFIFVAMPLVILSNHSLRSSTFIDRFGREGREKKKNQTEFITPGPVKIIETCKNEHNSASQFRESVKSVRGRDRGGFSCHEVPNATNGMESDRLAGGGGRSKASNLNFKKSAGNINMRGLFKALRT